MPEHVSKHCHCDILPYNCLCSYCNYPAAERRDITGTKAAEADFKTLWNERHPTDHLPERIW